MNLNGYSQTTRYGIAVGAVFTAVLLTLLIRFAFTLNPTPLIVLAVFAAAWFGGRYPGLLAALLSDLAIDFFFEEPAYQFNLAPAHIIRFGILAVIALLASARKSAEDRLRAREQQQAAVATLGQKALSAIPLSDLFAEAAGLVRKTLEVDFCGITELVEDRKKLRFVGASGWQKDVIGHEVDYTPDGSLAGYVLHSGEPTIFRNLKKNPQYTPSKILSEHNVNSGLGVAIRHGEKSFGVLGGFTRKNRSFSRDDLHFLQAVANVLAEAIERMHTETIVREQREWLRTTLASIGDGVIATDRDGLITFMNPVAEGLTGWRETDAIGKPLREVFQIVDEESRRVIENPVERVIREGVIVGLANHTILLARDGRQIPIDDSAAPIEDENKNITGVVLVFHDISERKQIEKNRLFLSNAAGIMTASLDLEETLSALAKLIVPALADLCAIDLIGENNTIRRVAVTHADASKTELVEAVKSCSALDMDSAVGIPNVMRSGKAEFYAEPAGVISPEIICSDTDKEVLRQMNASAAMVVPLIAHGRTLGAISLLLTEDGRVFQEKDLRFAEDFAGRAALAIDNARLYQTVQEANRIKDEFLATLSHELRTPLNSILGWASLLRTSRLAPEKVVGAIRTIERNALLQKQIVEDVLDVSGIITGKLRLQIAPVEPGSVIEAAIETVRPSAAAKDIELEFSQESVIPKISADAGRLQQVMWNLLSNAVKFTPKGGRIEITLGVFESNLRVEVRDNGQGIAPDFLPFVFDRFQQADSSRTRAHGGLGLGLAIVRYIIEMHGGVVRAESAGAGAGAAFIITLPVKPILVNNGELALPKLQPDELEDKDAHELENLNILLVDDDADARLMLITILEGYGARVKAVSSSAEGLANLQAAAPDVLISDIGMPGEDGYTFIRKVRNLNFENNCQIPAIALTAYAREEDRAQALSAGYQLHLAKPIDPLELIDAVKSLISDN